MGLGLWRGTLETLLDQEVVAAQSAFQSESLRLGFFGGFFGFRALGL